MEINHKEMMREALFEAITKAGNQSALSRICGVTPQAVQQWVAQGKVSRANVKNVADGTGVDRYRLRPDV